MSINNATKAAISYAHAKEIQRLFKQHVKGNLCIDHFSLNIFFGDGQSFFLSPTPQMADALCKHNFVDSDSNYEPSVYRNYSVYPWRAVQQHDTDLLINFIKEEKFAMRSGMMIVRDLGQGRYVMYSVATHRRDNPDFQGQFRFLYHSKADLIAEMGDFMYDGLLPIINQYTLPEGVLMPPIHEGMALDLHSAMSAAQQTELMLDLQNTERWESSLKRASKMHLQLIQGGRVGRSVK